MIVSKVRMERRRDRDLRKCANVKIENKVVLFRSNKYIYASLMKEGRTLVQISTLNKGVPEKLKGKNNIEACEWVGSKLAEKLNSMQIGSVFISKSGYKFHGGIQRLIEIVRERGLKC